MGMAGQVLPVVTLQTHKPQDSLTNRSCSTHISLNGSSKSDKFFPVGKPVQKPVQGSFFLNW